MTLTSLRWPCVFLFLLVLGGCSGNVDGLDPSTWFNPNQAQDNQNKNIRPGFGQGPLAAPNAAPTVAVQKQPIGAPALNTDNKTKVAILLPLSGSNASLGQAMLNAAQMAVFDTAPENFELMPRDTETKGGAQAATRDAIGSGARLILGPVFASHIPDVRAEAMQSQIPVIALSSDTSLKNQDVFIMGFAPGPQVERIISYASQRGLKRFAALVPATPYGTLVGQAFQVAVSRAGGAIVAFEAYDPAQHDSQSHVVTLSMLRKQIDAIFLPETGGDLALIAGQLAAAGFDNKTTHMLGTGLWDEPNLGHTQSYLIGGWYAAPNPETRRVFIENYRKTYGQEPLRLTTLAYDATALAASLAKHGMGNFDTVSLTNPNGFFGLDGVFRLLPNGGVERGLAINEVTLEGSRVIDPAPTSFASVSN